jgi:hypothetical protein
MVASCKVPAWRHHRSAPYAVALAMLPSKISLSPSWHAVSVLIIKTYSNLHENKIARPIGVVIFM